MAIVTKSAALMEDETAFPHSLVPLTLGVRLVHERVYANHHVPNVEQHLSAIATAIARLVPIYEYGQKPQYAAQKLSAIDLYGGSFRAGGKELSFIDGRTIKLSLAVTAADLERVVNLLIQARDDRTSGNSSPAGRSVTYKLRTEFKP